jgi:hypothetical protein
MRKVSLILGLSLLAVASTARAQETAPPALDSAAPPALDSTGAPAAAPAADAMSAPAAPAPAGYPNEYALRPLTLSAGTFQATVPVVLNLSKNAVLKPVWVPLDLRYGVNNQLEVFVSHNYLGAPAAFGQGGVCLGGTSRNCEKFYNNINVGGRFSFLKSNGVELSGLAALDVRRLSDPMRLAIDVGVGFKYVSAPISIKVAPQIGIGANKRSDGNKEVLSVPVQIAFQATPQLAAFLDTGIFGSTDQFGDVYGVPVGIGASFLVQHGLDVGAEFMLRQALAGSKVPSDMKGVNDRTLTVFAAYRTN